MESVEKAAATDGVSTEVQKSLPTLLVMLPALNEAATVASVIGRIPRNIDGVGRVEVLLIDDGSTDDTVALARGAGASVISHGYNRGVGAALQTGMDEAIARRVDIVVNMDSDGQFSPENIRDLIQPILAGRADEPIWLRHRVSKIPRSCRKCRSSSGPVMPVCRGSSVPSWGNVLRTFRVVFERIRAKRFCGSY